MKYLLSITCFFTIHLCIAQVPSHYKQVKSFNYSLQNIIKASGLDSSWTAGEDGSEQVSFAVIDLNGKRPVIGGFNFQNFIYPASVYKMYVAMEILKQVSNNKYALSKTYIVLSPNDVDRTREINTDPRPLLKSGDTVTINYLLDLMITRSDNSAANCLVDIAGRENINTTMHQNGWYGSEVTRKFLSRKFEDPGYDTIKGTETSALHAADFMFKVYSNQLINPWVSMQMKALLGRQLDKTKIAAGLPPNTMYYHKTGWWSIYTHDVGIVDDGHIKYIIALFIPLRETDAIPKMKEVSRRVYELMKNLHPK
ncbi:MAG: serine hydrolase [Ferruginibacter sp.]